jgi:hypothetical protein
MVNLVPDFTILVNPDFVWVNFRGAEMFSVNLKLIWLGWSLLLSDPGHPTIGALRVHASIPSIHRFIRSLHARKL